MIWLSENTPPKAGMAPGLPFRIRSASKSSLCFVPASFGPLPGRAATARVAKAA